jgi:O-antigen/teichoic acid export membrane protein
VTGTAAPVSSITGSAFGPLVARTAVCNVAAALTAGLSGILIARALGPSARGDYAAISVWLVVAFTVGDLGMTAATTFFVARDPRRRYDYLATSQVITVVSALTVLPIGMLAAPLLAQHDPDLTMGYRVTTLTCGAALVGFSRTAALQAMSLGYWNVVRVSQPVCYLLAVAALWCTGRLGLITALLGLLAATVLQSALAYGCCRRRGLIAGRAATSLVKPLARYGAGELATTAPSLATARLDQIVLSVAAPPAGLGHYAVASSLTSLAVPLVSALGHVAFPRLASAGLPTAGSALLRRRSILASGGISLAGMTVLALTAPWLVPVAFGADFAESVTLIWLLAPAGVFLPCAKVCADLLRGHGRPQSVARVQTASALVMAALLAGLVPPFAERGAAVATSATAVIGYVLMRRTLRRATCSRTEP